MGIRVYEVGEHPAGFVGIRISRKVGVDNRQNYLSYKASGKVVTKKEKERLMKKAQQLFRGWDKEAVVISKENSIKKRIESNHPNIKRVHATGYTGLRCVILCERKMRGGELRAYYSPAIVVRLGRRERAFRLSKYDVNTAWKDAVAQYGKHYKIDDADLKRIIKDCPDKGQFRKIRTSMNKQGHEIPLDALKKHGL